MRKIVFFLAVIILSVCLLEYSEKEASAAFWSDSRLVTINGREYTSDEFKNWWSHWNDKKTLPVPDSPDLFIDQQLLIQQAIEMEHDQNPRYLNQLRVFLKFRSLMALRNEEINSKIKISDEDINKYFYENYSPVYFLQVLTFKDLTTAVEAYTKMEPFNGQPAGRLFVADFQGLDPDDGGPLSYEEAKATPDKILKAKKEAWLEVIKKLKPGDIARPFVIKEGGEHAVILRLESRTRPGDEEVESKKSTIKSIIFKARSRQKTKQLIEKLMDKYHVVIDEELLAQVDLDKEYKEDFLRKTVISMDDLEVTVADLIINMKKEVKVRSQEATQEFIKQYMMSNIISQTVIDKEALNRHYEERPPLKKTWEFFKGNKLIATLMSDIKNKAKATDEDIVDYYNLNKAKYVMPGQIQYSLVKGEPALIDDIWKELLNDGNKDIVLVAEKYGKAVRDSTMEEGKLPPNISEAVSKISIGQISNPFAHDNGLALLKLKGRTKSLTMPIAMVRDVIENELNEKKYSVEKASYLKKIRSRSDIKVNNKVWNKLKKEL